MLSSEDNRARINGSRLVSPSSLEKHRDGGQMEMDEVIPALSSKFFFVCFPSPSFHFLFLLFHPSSDAHRHRPLLHRGR